MTRCSLPVTFALAAVLAGPALGGIIDVAWVGPNGGLWHNTSHWDPDTIPNNGGGFEYHAVISSTRSGALVNLGSNATISQLTIGTDDAVNINNARSLTLVSSDERSSGLVNNAGLIEVNSTGNTTHLYVSGGPVMFTGGGIIRLSDHINNRFYRSGTLGSIINLDNVIEGSGHIGWSSIPTAITNNHFIIANQPTPLNVHANNTLLTNTGEMRAENGGTLQINAGTYDNSGGLIEARSGSVVDLNGSATITGGTLATQGDGVFLVTISTPRWIDLDHTGHTIIENSRNLELAGDIHNSGLIEVNSTGSTTHLYVAEGPVTLSGGGTIHLSDHLNSRFYRSGSFGSIVNMDNVIEGSGHIGWSSIPTAITNHHLIIANQPTPLNVHANSTLLTNTGEMRAENGGTLQINAGTYDNIGGLIEARAGSLVDLSGNATITGGTLNTEGDGMILVTTSTPRWIDLDHTGHTMIENARTLHVTGAIHNSGLIEVSSSGNSTYFMPTDCPVTLTGGGTIRLSDNANNWIYRSGAEGSINNVDNTIEGAGNLGWSGIPTDINNQHLIIANVTNSLNLHANSALFTNEGELRAEDGGTLRINTGTYDNTGGLILAKADSIVDLNGNALITGGTITTEDNGIVLVTASTPRWTDINHAGHTRIQNGRTLHATGTIANTGLIELDSTGSSTYFRPVGGDAVTLSGGGTVQMSDNTNNWMYRADAGSYWINQDNTIRGAGNIGWTGSRNGIINHGEIIADGLNLLQLAPDSDIGFINHGLFHTQNTGGLAIAGGMMNQQGQVLIDADSTLTRSGAHYIQTAGTTTVNGTLVVTGSGNQLRLQGGVLNGNGQVNGTLNNTAGIINPGLSTGLLTINGTYVQSNAGVLTIEIDGETPITEHDVIDVNGNAQLGGYLQPVFGENYNPANGTQWTVLTANAVSGTFNAVLPCQEIRLVYQSDAVVIERTGVLKIGDMNCDGAVDVSDLLILLGAWGQCPAETLCPADLNADGTVDVSDLLILLSNWG